MFIYSDENILAPASSSIAILACAQPPPSVEASSSEQLVAENADIVAALMASPNSTKDLASKPPTSKTFNPELAAAITSLAEQPTSPLSLMLLEAIDTDRIVQEFDRLAEDDIAFYKSALERTKGTALLELAAAAAPVEASTDPRLRRSSIAAGTPTVAAPVTGLPTSTGTPSTARKPSVVLEASGRPATLATSTTQPNATPAAFVDRSRDPRRR